MLLCKNITELTEKNLYSSLARSPAILFHKETQVFLSEFCRKFSRTSVFMEHSLWLLPEKSSWLFLENLITLDN